MRVANAIGRPRTWPKARAGRGSVPPHFANGAAGLAEFRRYLSPFNAEASPRAAVLSNGRGNTEQPCIPLQRFRRADANARRVRVCGIDKVIGFLRHQCRRHAE